MIENATDNTSRQPNRFIGACNERVEIREIGPMDASILQAFFQRLTDDARYLRFLSPIGEVSDQLVTRLIDIDQHMHVGLMAVVREDDQEIMIGEARYVVNPSAPSECEFAIAISSEWQGRGLGRKLLQLLERRALEAGLQRITAQTLPYNEGMIGLARALGYRVLSSADDFRLRTIAKSVDTACASDSSSDWAGSLIAA